VIFVISANIWWQHDARAADYPRVVSLNLCTDQLLVALADPGQIIGLSPFAGDAARSWDAEKGKQYPLLSGGAEDVLVRKPDFVVAGTFTRRATLEFLKDKGIPVVEFDIPRSMDDVKAQITKMGGIVGHSARAELELRSLNAAISKARQAASQKSYRVLALSPRGWTSGRDSLMDSLLATVGLLNAAQELGFGSGGFASLETIVSLKPDLLLVSRDGHHVESNGEAFLLHPALQRFYPLSKRIVIPEKLTVCGGPLLAEALDRLVLELERFDGDARSH
jgi:iron complex transport system substrate-binding protein